MCFSCYDVLQFPLTYNGKVEVGLYCYRIADVLTKVLRRCSLSSPLPNIWNLSKALNLIGCHGNQKDKFAEKYSKIISSEAIWRMKLKLCRNVHNISLYKKCVFYCHCHCSLCFRCYGNLKFPLTYNEKSESTSRSLLLCHCRYFYKCLLSSPPPNITKLYKFLILICWKFEMLN